MSETILNPSTISEVETAVQTGLEALRSVPFDQTIKLALNFIVPPGYRPIVQLEEDGRKKRSTAAASNWSPETGEVVIFFERDPKHVTAPAAVTVEPAQLPAAESAPFTPQQPPSRAVTIPTNDLDVQKQYVEDCCHALAEAEKAGKAFIAFKWFRDEALQQHGFSWASNPESRQKVLARAIESGAITTGRIPNPRFPTHPTTTVTLNRSASPARATGSV